MSEIKEVKVGSVVWAVWPNDPKRRPRPGIVVGIKRDDHGPLYCVAYGTTKGVDGRSYRVLPWHVIVTAVESLKLGMNAVEGRFDVAQKRWFPSVQYAGDIDSVPGLRKRVIQANCFAVEDLRDRYNRYSRYDD